MSPNPAILTWPRAVAGGGALSGSFIQSLSVATNTPTIINIGTADDTRTVIVIALTTYSDPMVRPTATLNGVSMAEDLYNAGPANGNPRTSIFRLAVATGTTATLTLSYGSPVIVYRLAGATAVVSATASVLTNTLSITGATSGVVIASATNSSRGKFTGGVTEDVYWNLSGTHCVISGHSASAGSLTITQAGTNALSTSAVAYAPA